MTETETKNPGEKTLKVASTKTLTLKRGVEQGVVRQSFSHGRTKPVVVEKVKRRVIGPGEAKVEVASPAPQAASGRRTAKAASTAAGARRRTVAATRKRPSARPSKRRRNDSARKKPRPSWVRLRALKSPRRMRKKLRARPGAVRAPRVRRRPLSPPAAGRRSSAAG